jgi:hypothetical protein
VASLHPSPALPPCAGQLAVTDAAGVEMWSNHITGSNGPYLLLNSGGILTETDSRGATVWRVPPFDASQVVGGSPGSKTVAKPPPPVKKSPPLPKSPPPSPSRELHG